MCVGGMLVIILNFFLNRVTWYRNAMSGYAGFKTWTRRANHLKKIVPVRTTKTPNNLIKKWAKELN